MLDKNIFSVDAESDGLYGDVFAIGAVVLSPEGELLDRFAGRAEADSVQDVWVKENIVPVCDSLPIYNTRRELREAFWSFWLKHSSNDFKQNDRGCLCVGDFGAPVEALLFRKCVEDDTESRMWKGPYPMHELGTALLLAGIDPDINRIEYSEVSNNGKKHNPYDDALTAGLCWQKATNKN